MRPSILVSGLILTATVFAVPSASYAQEAIQRPAELRTGSCSSIGDTIAPLNTVVAPGGDALGPDGATPVEQSVTVVPQLLADLLAGGYVVVVEKSIDEPGTPAACGVVGGAVAEDGTLAVGLSPMNGTRLDGVAYFAPKRDDGGTTVTLLMVDNRTSEEASEPAGPVGKAGEDGMITIGGVTENTDSVTMTEDGSGPAPAEEATVAPAPDTGEKDGKGRREGEAAVDSASGADVQDGQGDQGGADATGGKQGKQGKDNKGGRGGNDGNGGNAGNDGAAAAGTTAG